MDELENKETTHKNPFTNIVLPIFIGLLLFYLMYDGPILLNSWTSNEAEIREVTPRGGNVVRKAVTDNVNLFRNLRILSKKSLDELDLVVGGYMEYSGQTTVILYIHMFRNSSLMTQVKKGDPLTMRMADGKKITVRACMDGEVKRHEKRSRRSIARSVQYVNFITNMQQLDSICSGEITDITIHTETETYSVTAREGIVNDLRKRYNLLYEYLQPSKKWAADEPKLVTTETKDPTIARFARTDKVGINDDFYVSISGYKDNDGDISIVLNTTLICDTNSTFYVKSKNKLEVSLVNGEIIEMYAFTNGSNVRSHSEPVRYQSINYRTSSGQMESICASDIESVMIEAADNTYTIYARPGASSDIQKRYQLLQDHLHCK